MKFGFGRQGRQGQGRWLLIAGALGLLVFGGMTQWNPEVFPETFPPELEALDQDAWQAGAETIFPDRYQTFHRQLQELRTRFGEEHQKWLGSWDPKDFFASYQALAQQGHALLRETVEHASAVRTRLQHRVGQEQRQVSRLRTATRAFNLNGQLRHLSRSESLLDEAGHLLRLDQPQKSHKTLVEALNHLNKVEQVVLTKMNRYQADAQLVLWRRWADEAVNWTVGRADTAFVVLKARRHLLAYQNGKVVAKYPVEFGFFGLEDKLHEGDGATPEGNFQIIKKKSKGATKFHKALLLNYPTPTHIHRFQTAKRQGLVPPNRGIGGLIEIHGEGPSAEQATSGCVGLSNNDMDAVYEMAREGAPVTIIGALNKQNPIAELVLELEAHIHQRSLEPTPDPRGL